MLSSLILATITWLPANGATDTESATSGGVYQYEHAPIIGNGLASGDVSSEEVCRVTLVGTNTVDVTSFLGMTNFPAEAENWWAIYNLRMASDQASLTGNEGASVAASHASDISSPFSLSQALPSGSGNGLELNFAVGNRSYNINCDPTSNSTVSTALDFFKASILAIVGLGVGFLIARDWRDVVSRISSAQQAQGFGVSALGNNAPMLFAQINAGIMTLAISAAIITITAFAVGLASVWVVNCFADVSDSGVGGTALYLFHSVVPVVGLASIGGVYLGWLATQSTAEYLVKIICRHTTA